MANSIILKRLQGAQPGTAMTVTYEDYTGHTMQIQGIVTENDFETTIVIASETEEAVIDYDFVKTLKIVTGGVGTVQPPVSVPQPVVQPQPVQQTAAPVLPAAPAPKPVKPEPKPAGKKPLYERSVEFQLECNEAAVQLWIKNLGKSQWQILERFYQRFKNGEITKDRDRARRAAREAAAEYIAQYDSGMDWSVEAARLCGAMLERKQIFDKRYIDVFTIAGLHAEAAYYAWKAERTEEAGIYAAAALAAGCEEDWAEPLFIILAHTCVGTGDASAVAFLADCISEENRPLLRELAAELLEKKGAHAAQTQSLREMAEQLDTLFDKHIIADEAKYILYGEPGEQPAVIGQTEPEQNRTETGAEESGQQEAGTGREEPEREVEQPREEARLFGWLSKVIWAGPSGQITVSSGDVYSFDALGIQEDGLKRELAESGGKPKNIWVSFIPDGVRARAVISAPSPLKEAEKFAREKKYDEAVEAYTCALGSPEQNKAMNEILSCGYERNGANQSPDKAKEIVSVYEAHKGAFTDSVWNCRNLAEMYFMAGNMAEAVRFLQQALSHRDMADKTRADLLQKSVRYIRGGRNQCEDKKYLELCIRDASEWIALYKDVYASEGVFADKYPRVLYSKCETECELGMLAEAEEDYRALLDTGASSREASRLFSMITELKRKRNQAAEEAAWISGEKQPAAEASEPAAEEPAQQEDEEEEIKPYEDSDGWQALELTKKDVVGFAMSAFGRSVPAALTYLRAASSLQPEIMPIYRIAAAAANDPAERPEYSISGLQSLLENDDSDYSVFTGYCLAAAFLRTSFISGRGYDYSAQGVRQTISVIQQMPELDAVCDLLENFRETSSGKAIDLYAAYRTGDADQIREERQELSRRAERLFIQFILNPPHEKTSLVRILETRKIIFDKDGWIAKMLGAIRDQDSRALEYLEAEKENFRNIYMGGADEFRETDIRKAAIEDMIDDGWERAKANCKQKKNNSSLWGQPRNNLMCNIRDVLQVICRWYDLSEQGDALGSDTEEGKIAYSRLHTAITEKFEKLSEACRTLAEESVSEQESAGAAVLKYTADELRARLEGTWKLGQERYMYIEFLQTSHVMLDENFLPEIESTFCALPQFNILARIRAHIAEEKADFAARIGQIYGQERKYNDYGTAARIQEYLADTGRADEAAQPENALRYREQSQKKAKKSFEEFLDNYALDRSYGRIMQSDPFCYTLGDTVRYWYNECVNSSNFGFFVRLLDQANEQIRVSATQYERMLETQLDALIENNREGFDRNPGYEDAIRKQIEQQNFIVAEDYMNRFRAGDFTLKIRHQEALDTLENFWAEYTENHRKVADSSRDMATLLSQRIHNRDTKGARRLAECWLQSGRRTGMGADRIVQLLTLLGWKGVKAQAVDDSNTELYSIRQDARAINMVSPAHPIAAFGSRLATRGMQVVCLYGNYRFEKLYEKMRSLDAYKTNKLILVDHALSVADRHALARKLKQKDSSLGYSCLVIDRVALCYLAEHYNENLVNKTLMAIGIPFTYCQPYIADSDSPLPPEMFIGRRDELLRIESRDGGVNLIYGGRQLGKSALLKKARDDVDGVDDQRAVLVDINMLNCLGAAKALAGELVRQHILEEDALTDNWKDLCDSVLSRMCSKEDISFLLVMLDEGDDFIKDCSSCGYEPIVFLERLQQKLEGRFRFVIAGLHDVLRFYRETSLVGNSTMLHLPSLKVLPFSAQEAEELLTRPLSYLGMSIENKNTASQILATVNYYPGLIQRYCTKLIESLRAADYAGYEEGKTPPYRITDDHLRRIMADRNFVAEISQKFFSTLELDKDQENCYQPIALLIGWMYFEEPDKAKAGFSAKDVLACAKEMDTAPLMGLDAEKISVLMQELEELNILRSVSDSTYLLASKNFRDLLGNQMAILDKLSEYSVTEE